MASKNANKWLEIESGKIVVSEGRPVAKGDERWNALYAKSRVRGESYTPYEAGDASAAWVADANRGMADAARSNFERKQSR